MLMRSINKNSTKDPIGIHPFQSSSSPNEDVTINRVQFKCILWTPVHSCVQYNANRLFKENLIFKHLNVHPCKTQMVRLIVP